jgi:glycosyltransferase involved in cell wall biosynthesis
MTDPLRLAIFTICSNNFVPAAKTFLDSARRHHPEADLFLCLADRMIEMDGLYDPSWTIVETETLEIDDFDKFAFRYGIMELNTAVKPFMFAHLCDRLNYDAALYFDPDIEIFRPLTEIIEQLRLGASFVLTPHLCAPNESEFEPNDITIMRAGVYNLGFLGVGRGEEASSIIAWWARRLRFQCISAQEQGIFVDQKFMDLVPGFAPHAHVCHDVTVNVAYWNIRQRVLAIDGDGFTVNGQKLSFFHYSGFNPREPRRLSKYETGSDPMSPALTTLTAGYAGRLMANGYGTVPAATYAYGRFASGTVIHHLVREMFREWHQDWPDDPFATYESFLDEPWPGAARPSPSHVVTNFIKFLHGRFPSLSQRLDLRQPHHARELVDWFVIHAGHSLRLDLKLIEPAASRMGRFHPVTRLPDLPPGGTAQVSVIGYLRTASGVGEVGRQTLRTLEAAGVAAECLDVALNVAASRNDTSCEALIRDHASAPVQIFNINADQLALVLDHVTPRLRRDAWRINIPFWELSRFPFPWLGQFAGMDEVWAPSRFIQASIAGLLDKPVIHMPVAIEIGTPSALPRARFGLPDQRFLFFFAFDFLSYLDRKNPKAVIAAFRLAFPRAGAAGLVLKCMNGSLVPDQLAAFEAEISDRPDIVLIDKTLSRAETLGLLAAVDAVVSLHRSEGLGLLVAEAMLLRKPVIATDYSATREFLDATTGYPVDCQLVELQAGDYPFAEGQVWAAPDVPHAAWLMRRLHDDPTRSAPLVRKAFDHLDRNHSYARVGQLQAARLRWLTTSMIDA